MVNATADSEIRAATFKHCRKQFQMIRRPDVVVAEICNMRSGCCLNTGIVWERLRTRVLGKAYSADGTTEFLPNHLLGIIRATISYNDDLERRVRLLQGRLQRWDNKARSIVGRNDDGKTWKLFPA